MLLPRGFSELRHDLGVIIRRHRLAHGSDGGLSQAEMAQLIGISRETLSRIESGCRWPSYDTLDKIIGLFEVEWDVVAIKGASDRPSRHHAPDCRQDLGLALRAGRLHERLSLRALAERTGISYSQLSRIERAESTRSRVVDTRVDSGSGKIDDDTTFQFTHPELARLAEKGMGLPSSAES
ncbi:helix-turn-helix domain-containing protein [Erythrobacter sp. QSSC1-22B]|uniref:helix-turn-helix domain-containing protein n=1 Tax=Erythrobacter sp. QSSC1-22B TaxID=1860125 RepID=UPI003516BA07